MTDHRSTLVRLLSDLTGSLDCAATISSDGIIANRVGSFDAYDNTGLARTLFGPYGDPTGTFAIAADHSENPRLLPQVYAQGDLFAFIDILDSRTVVVALGRKTVDNIDYMKLRHPFRDALATALTQKSG